MSLGETTLGETSGTAVPPSGKADPASAGRLRAHGSRAAYAVAGAVAGAMAGFLLSALPSRIYEADVGLVVPVSQPEGAVESASALRDRIVADAVLRPVVETQRLDTDPMFGTAGVPGTEAVIARLRARIAVQAERAPGTYALLVQADSAEKAARLANAVADAALGSPNDPKASPAIRGAAVADASPPPAKNGLAARIEAAGAARRSAENALAAIQSSGQGGDEAALLALRETIARLRAREAAARERAAQAQLVIAASRRALESSTLDAAAGVPPQLLSMATDIAALSRLSALQAQVLGPQNPALAPLLAEIERMRRNRIAETERWAGESTVALAQARAEEAAAVAERERAERRVTSTQARVEALREAQLALERARSREAALREIAGLGDDAMVTAPASRPAAAAVTTTAQAAPVRPAVLAGSVVRRAVPPERPIHPPVLAIILMASLAGGAFGAFAGLRRTPTTA